VNPLLRIQFGLHPNSDSSAYVLYQGSRGPIPLKFLIVTATPSAGRYGYTN
jgi:hypothetical protein